MFSERSKERNEAHPLNGLSITDPCDWSEWKEHWLEEMKKEHPSAKTLVGLLHGAFDVNANEEERIPFLLDIADGYRNDAAFPKDASSSNCQQNPKNGPRKKVARKAYDVLCDNFFKEAAGGNRVWWEITIGIETVFKTLLLFLGREGDNIPNTDKEDGRSQITRSFIHQFVTFAWKEGCDWKSEDKGPQNKKQLQGQMFFDARPQLIEILSETREIGFLVELVRDTHFNIDEKCIEKLREISLKSGPNAKSETANPVELVYYHHSRFIWRERDAAETLILLRVLLEQKRLDDAVKKAEINKREAEYREQEIQDARKKVEDDQQKLQELIQANR